jgi:hypothetical protein
MKRTLLKGACILVLGLLASTGPASAGVGLGDCKVPTGALVQLSKGNFGTAGTIFGSANTNKGGGNGGEIAIAFIGCATGIDGQEAENAINIDSNDLGGIISTDPGNSNQDNDIFP